MLACHYSKLIILLFLQISWCAPWGWCQQTPASRYQPTVQPQQQSRNQSVQSTQVGHQGNRSAPPSVHVPPATAERIQPPVGYSFSDGNSQLNRQPDRPNAGTLQRPGTIRQTSFVSDESRSQEPTVPNILTQRMGNSETPSATARTSPGVRPTTDFLPSTGPSPPTPAAEKTLPNSPAQFANEMNQLRSSPRVAPDEIDRVAQIRQEVEAIQKKIAETKHNQSTQGSTEHIPTSTAPPAAMSQFDSSTTTRGGNPASASSSSSQGSANFSGSSVPPSASPALPATVQPVPPQAIPVAGGSPGESFNDFMAFPKEDRPDTSAEMQENETSANMNVPADMNVPASFQSMDLPANRSDRLARSERFDGFAATEGPAAGTAIRLTMPTLSVETFGPQSIGINRPCQFNIVVKNEGQSMAERILVSVDIPSWVEIDKVNLTTGEREITEGQPLQRLLWKIDRVPPQSSQTITLTTIPRRAEVFDLGVEWTLVPRAGAAKINVTQPKLEMTIVGPDEVQFGESVIYQVAVRNNGTGAAENVMVILSEALNGDRDSLGDIPAGEAKSFEVKLIARTPGELDLAIQAVADNDSQTSASRKLMIRRANLEININGPSLRYAGTSGQYLIEIRNTGDARAEEVVAAMGLPKGVRFLGGIESFKLIEGGLRWPVGSLEPGQSKEYRVQCQLDASGDLQLEVGTQAKGALQASHAMITQVQTIADLVMIVNDPPGPLTTGEEISYEIVVHNRGTRAAKDVDVFMILSQGLEPKSGTGRDYRIPRDGAIQFATIPQIDPGAKVSLSVVAVASKPGTHVFRAHLVCEEADSREIKEGTSRFFGDEVPQTRSNTANQSLPGGDTSSFPAEIKR